MTAEGCPKCHSADVHSPTFTWWGGALGPKLFKHTVCRSCGFGYNRVTRQSNQTAIAIYFVIALIVSIALVVTLQMMQ